MKTSSGSVWTPYRGQKAHVEKKGPIIFDLPQIYSLFSEPLNLIQYFRTFGQQVLT